MPEYQRRDIVRCHGCGNVFVANSRAAVCGKCRETDLSPLRAAPKRGHARL